MNCQIFLTVALTISSVTVLATADDHQTATGDSFQRLGKLMVGRWRSEVKFIADWPGESQGRGEMAHGFAEFNWKVDHHLISGVESVGDNSGYWIVFRDPVRNKIRLISQSSQGGPIEADMWPKAPHVFGWKITAGGLPDGQALTGCGEYEFSKDGKKLTMTGRLELAGKLLDPYKDVYYRLSPLSDD